MKYYVTRGVTKGFPHAAKASQAPSLGSVEPCEPVHAHQLEKLIARRTCELAAQRVTSGPARSRRNQHVAARAQIRTGYRCTRPVHICMRACAHVRMDACTHVCMCVCTHVCVCVCGYACGYAYACMCTCMHACGYTCMHVCVCVCQCVRVCCACVCRSMCARARVHVRMYACMVVCMYACVHLCMHARTHAFTLDLERGKAKSKRATLSFVQADTKGVSCHADTSTDFCS